MKVCFDKYNVYGVCLDINTLNVQDMRVHCSKFLAAKISAIVLNTNSSQTMNQLLLNVLLTVVFRVNFCLS